jgi:FdhE protein
MTNSWQRRIRRAEELAAKHSYAAEVLRFYARIAAFQQVLYEKLDSAASRSEREPRQPLAGPPELPQLIPRFGDFLSLVEQVGPARLAETARMVKSQDQSSWAERLDQFWSSTALEESPALESFFSRAFLQPYAEFIRNRAGMQWPGYGHPLCPFCNRKPGLAVMRQMGDGGQRSLICSFCLAEWTFRRIVCVSCGEEDDRKLPVYTANEFDYVRVECCDTCRHYLKTVDLTRNGLADAVVDEIAAVPLDLWAGEHGYSKIESNLVGM